MTKFAATTAGGFLLGAIGVALVLFAILGGVALNLSNGQAQTCARSHGHWNATDTAKNGDAVDRVRECAR